MNDPVGVPFSSQFSESLFASNHVGMAISDTERFLYVNDAFCSLFGYSQDELRQLNFCDLTFAEDLEESLRMRDKLVVEDASVITMEKRYVRQDGSVFPGRVGVMAVRDAKHKLEYTIITIEDLSEMRRVTDALRESEKLEAQMLELDNRVLEKAAAGSPIQVTLAELAIGVEAIHPEMVCAIHMLDADGKTLLPGAAPHMPAEYQEVTNGFQLGPMIGSCGAAVHRRNVVVVEDVSADPLFEGLQDLMRNLGLRSSWSVPIIATDHRVLGTLCVYLQAPSRPSTKQLLFLCKVARMAALLLEIHWQHGERERLQEQILYAQKLESLGLLAGGIAHDFNNLLSAILANAELINAQSDEASTFRIRSEQIRRAALRAAGICRQMLAYSGKGKPANVDINLADLVVEIAELVRPSMSRDVQLNLECDADVPRIRGDEGMISQVILNLLTNAADAMQDRAGSIRVRTGVRVCDREFLTRLCPDGDLPEGPYVFAEIVDEGVGFDEASRAQLFDPFFTTKVEGRGLGLVAVQKIVRQHQGGILFDSTKGEGSVFCVFLPLIPALANESTSSNSDLTPVDRMRILLVDDEPIVRDSLAAMLEALGWEVITADNGAQAVEVFRQQQGTIDAVLLDQKMPGIDGMATARELRAIEADLPIVLMSGHLDWSAGEEAIRVDLITGNLMKPFTSDVLLKELTRVAQVRHRP